MKYLDNRVYPNLYPDTIWKITNKVEKKVFGFILPKPKPKMISKRDIESENDIKEFEDYYTNLLISYKERQIVPHFVF